MNAERRTTSGRCAHPAFLGHRSSIIVLLALLALTCSGERTANTTDDLGRPVVIPASVDRIVTLSPNLTEIVFALGAERKLAGTDDFSNHPAAAQRIPKVGGLQPNVEKIVSLAPDLVFASTEGNSPQLGPALAAAKIPLFVVRTDRLAEIPPAMTRLGAILDVASDAKVRELERAIEAQRRTRPKPPRVLFAVWTEPLYVAGRATFFDDLLALTGASNAVAVNGWPQYSLEALVADPPDIILYPRGAVTAEAMAKLLASAPGVRAKVVPVNEDLFQRPGPRMAEAAAELNRILDGS